MLELWQVSASSESGRINNVNIQFDKLGVNALLSPNVTFLDELVSILLGTLPLKQGKILLNGEDYFQLVDSSDVQLITGQNMLFQNLTAQENVLFSYPPFFYFNSKKQTSVYEKVLADTGFYLPAKQKVEKMTQEDRKILELLKCYYRKPKLLILRDLTNCLSYKNFAVALALFDLMRSRGTEILYLTSQWEEAVKIANHVTIFSHGKNYGSYPAERIAENPRHFFPIMVGSHLYQDTEEDNSKKIEILRLINENMQNFTDTIDLRKSIHVFSKHTMKITAASNCLIYLIDQQQNLLRIVAKDDQASRLMSVPQDCILQLAESQKEVYLNSNEGLFQKIFPAEATFRSVIFVPNKLSNGCRILIEAVYQDFYVYSEEDILLLRWASREIGILVEKTKLMGNSVLLQESHHRIKNNLQIIVSLLEMERVKLDTRGIARNDIPVVNEILDNISQRVQSMAHIHNILCKDNAANSVIDLYSIVREIASIYESSASMQLEFEEILVPYGMAVSFALVANELFNNSVKHNQGLAYNLQIHVSATLDDARGNYRIVFQDNGRGFPSILPKESDGGIGNVIIDSIIQMELCGTYQQKNQNGARVEIEIPASFILEDIKK